MTEPSQTTKAQRWALPLCAIAGALVIALGLANMRIPLFFPFSTVLIGASFAFIFTLALGMFLPDRWLHTDAQLLAFQFKQKHGLSDGRAETVLKAIQSAHGKATLLRFYGRSVHEDLQQDLNNVANHLDGIAAQLLDEPTELRQVQALIVRSDLLVDAAATHKDLRKKATEQVIAQSREKVLAGLAAFQQSFDEMEKGAAQRLMHRVSASADTAEMLLGRSSS